MARLGAAAVGAAAVGAAFAMEGEMLRVRLLVLGLLVLLPGAAAFAQADGGMKDPLPPAEAATTPEPEPQAEPTQCPDNMAPMRAATRR